MPDCPACEPAFTAYQIANAPKTDHFYEIFVKYERGGGYYVYYRSEVDLAWEDVPEVAMVDGDLHPAFLDSVESVMEITAGEYFAKMWE